MPLSTELTTLLSTGKRNATQVSATSQRKVTQMSGAFGVPLYPAPEVLPAPDLYPAATIRSTNQTALVDPGRRRATTIIR